MWYHISREEIPHEKETRWTDDKGAGETGTVLPRGGVRRQAGQPRENNSRPRPVGGRTPEKQEALAKRLGASRHAVIKARDAFLAHRCFCRERSARRNRRQPANWKPGWWRRPAASPQRAAPAGRRCVFWRRNALSFNTATACRAWQ